jgi:hypothetical protein
MALYERLIEIEEMNETLRGLELDNPINTGELQKKIIWEYAFNPVMSDALRGRQTITESLEELAEINKGIRRFLPHRKNKVHNERVEQMGELVSGVNNLRTYGIFYPDNAVTAGLETVTMIFGISYLMFSLWEFPRLNDSEAARTISTILSPPFGIVAGLALNRSGNLPTDETEYLDMKVKTL